MTQRDPDLQPARRPKARTWVGALIGLLIVIALMDGGVGPAISVLGVTVLAVGAWALMRGRAGWAGIVSRRAAGGVAIVGLFVSGVGGALTPASEESTAAVAATPSAGTATTPRSTATPTTPSPRPIVASPAPTTQVPPPLPPAPTLLVTCPAGGSNASPVFGQQISATAPYSVTIDYGDGDIYTNDDQNLAAVFSHTFAAAGVYTVQAVLTDAAGQTTSGSCMYNWTTPLVVPAPVVSSGGAGSGGSSASDGGSSSSGGGGGAAYYENCDAVRAAGAAPIYPGDPGFQQKFDRDNDGIGCE